MWLKRKSYIIVYEVFTVWRCNEYDNYKGQGKGWMDLYGWKFLYNVNYKKTVKS